MPLAPEKLAERARAVRLVVFDVDGVLTDGSIVFGPSGEALKAFHARDGMGMVLLRRAGFEVAILSARRTPIVDARMRDLGVALVDQGGQDKTEGLARLLATTGATGAQTAYMGDDVNDLPVFGRVGLSACPADAMAAVRAQADFVAAAAGGRGAARELCDLVLGART